MKLLCNYYVTLRCNSKCEFCNIWHTAHHNSSEQTLEEIVSNLQDLKRLKVKIIDFTGGEPLLYRHLVEALQLAKHYEFYTTLTTNCTLYKKYAAQLTGLIDLLFFSLQSTDEATHNKMCGIKSFASVIESIEIAKEVKQKISLLHTVTDSNIQDLPKMITFAQKHNCSLRINPCFAYFGNNALSKEHIAQLATYFSTPNVTVNLALLKFMEQGGNQITKPLCEAVKSIVVISPDNYLLLPCFHHATTKLKINHNLFALQNSQEVIAIEKQVGRFSYCKQCSITCYMRASLFKRYPYLSLKSWLKSLREMTRKQF